jgi:ABC-type Mn2+/Zn2+ transport system permease subunit
MSTINFSYDPEWLDTLSAPFMTNAFIAGLCIALAAGVMGYFTIARRSTFAAHALAHIGLPGATGAVLLGLPVSLGMGVFALGGALVIGALGKRVSEREIATGTVLAFARALGEYGATSMIAGYTPGKTATIATTVYQLWRTNDEAGALRWVLVDIVISAVVLLAVNLLEKQQKAGGRA